MPTIYKNNKCEFCETVYSGFGKKFCSTKCRNKHMVKEQWRKKGEL